MAKLRSGTRTTGCDGKGACRRRWHGRWLPTRACERCKPRRCRNVAVCGSAESMWAETDFFCARCVAFLACRPIKPLGVGPCPVCMEERKLHAAPGCAAEHGLCGPCLRRIYTGDNPLPTGSRDVVEWTRENRRELQHQQTCPCCRAGESRTARQRLDAIYAAATDTTSFARAVVVVGLAMAGGI